MKLLKLSLTSVSYGTEPVWINPASIQFVAPPTYQGSKARARVFLSSQILYVEESPDEIAKILLAGP